MAVKIRMTRMGRRHRPFYRINVFDSRSPRDGRIIEKLGHYDPLEKNPEKEIVLNIERVKEWLDKGATPTDAVSNILLRLGIKHKYAEEKKERRAIAKAKARAAGVPFDTADRVVLKKAAEAVKAAAEAEKKAAEDAEKAAAAKAKEDKAAAEKAAADKVAAEKAAAEKKPEEKPKKEPAKETAPVEEKAEETKKEEPVKEEAPAEEKAEKTKKKEPVKDEAPAEEKPEVKEEEKKEEPEAKE